MNRIEYLGIIIRNEFDRLNPLYDFEKAQMLITTAYEYDLLELAQEMQNDFDLEFVTL